ncbi:hypothetical protein [Nocardioides nanhaiensis]|uniref:DUF1772 domain-containing protein n=1 Tax=Nocardioides nanhaiensis TaxID=1476871 RepID=A0ABP8VWW1_9ACTN
MDATWALALAVMLHAGFQLTVTVLVYPALARVPAADWAPAHARHSRAITPLVALCYGALAGTAIWALLAAPRSPALVVTLACVLGSVLATATGAAPTHGRLGRSGPTPALLRRLLLADRVRAAFAVGAAAAALVAVTGLG